MIPMRAVNAAAEQDARYQMNSPLLFGTLQKLEPDAHVELLDLAPANASLLDYFSTYYCRLHLPGCRVELLTLRAVTDDDQPPLSAVLPGLLPMPPGERQPLDMVLLWDLPNYLDKPVLAALIAYLLPYCARHTVLHTYIHTRQTMPDAPGEYRLTAEQKVKVEMSTTWNTSSPAYYLELINKVFAPFSVDRGMLLANGLQEYILRLK